MTALRRTSDPMAADRDRSKLLNIDWSLILLVSGLVAIGSLGIYSATRGETAGLGLAGKQIGFFCVGMVAMLGISMIDYEKLRSWLGPIGLFTMVMLIAVLSPLGTEIKGTKGWFVYFGFSAQPAEFAKISLIVLLAALFSGRSGNTDPPRIAASLGVLGVISVMVLQQGETGSVLVYCAIALGVYLVAGVPARYLVLLVISGIGVASVIFTSDVLADYQAGASWAPDRVAELRATWGGTVTADTAARGLVTDATEPGEAVQAQAHNALADGVDAGTVHHGNQPAMNVAVSASRWRPQGSTRVLDRKGSNDISPIIAAALALAGLDAKAAPARFISF